VLLTDPQIYCPGRPDESANHRPGPSAPACDRTAAGRFAALSDRGRPGFLCHRDEKSSTRDAALGGAALPVVNRSLQRRNEMSILLKNKSLLFLPIGLTILIVIGMAS
jgi:hypothetical protein